MFLFLATPSEKCCKGEGVPEECMGFCTPPGPISKNDVVKICNPFLDVIIKCWSAGEGMVEFNIANLWSIILTIKLHRLLKIKSLMFFNYKIVIWNHAVIGCLLLFVNPFAMLQCVIVVPLVNVAKPASNANGKYSCIYYIESECIMIMWSSQLQWFCKRIGKLFWKHILFRCLHHEEYIGRWMIWFKAFLTTTLI